MIALAWVSVHEKIIGRKLRSLSKEIGCSQNECIGLLIRLWLWGLNNADKTGEIIDADRSDIADVLVVGLEKNIDTMDAVNAMIKVGWIDERDGVLFLHDWDEWQKQWYKYSESLEKDRGRKRTSRPKTSQDQDEIPTTEKQPEIEPEPEKKPAPEGKTSPEKKTSRETVEYDTGFNEFWDAYPRKTGKGEAYAKYKARLSDGWSKEELTEAARRYASECEMQHTEQRYIKHPKTFLSDKTPFTDYLPAGLNGAGTSSRGDMETEMPFDDDPYGEWR